MKFRNYAERNAWIAWTHDAGLKLAHVSNGKSAIGSVELSVLGIDFVIEYADVMLAELRKRDGSEEESCEEES